MAEPTAGRTLYLVRHAKAEARGPAHPDDRMRPLTARGQQDAAALARALSRLGWRLGRLFSSPYTRARQTAEALAPAAEVQALPALCTDDYGTLLSALSAELEPRAGPHENPGERPLTLVGHEPYLGELSSLLLSGERRRCRVRFKKGGLLVLFGEVAAGRMRLEGYLTPAVYRRLG